MVDASALAALVFGEPRAEEVAERLEGHELAAPTLLPYELASVLSKKLAAYPAQREALLSAWELFPHLGIRQIGIAPLDLVELAEQTSLTVYDAAYLWLAEAAGGELVTLDERLAAAARARRSGPR